MEIEEVMEEVPDLESENSVAPEKDDEYSIV